MTQTPSRLHASRDRGGSRDAGDRVTITPCPDGPLLVRGDVELVAPDGSVLPRRRRTLALCRCGGSSLAPLCDGTHKATGFTAP